MIKAIGKMDKDTLFIGLSYGDLDRFSAGPLGTYIMIDGKELGMSHDVLIFSGRTQAEISDFITNGFSSTIKEI